MPSSDDIQTAQRPNVLSAIVPADGGVDPETDETNSKRRLFHVFPGLRWLPSEDLAGAAHSVGSIAPEWIDLANLELAQKQALFLRLADLCVEHLPETPLGHLAPGLARLEGEVSLAQVPTRMYNGLRRGRMLAWQSLASTSPALLLRLRNVGRKSISEIIALAFWTVLEGESEVLLADDRDAGVRTGQPDVPETASHEHLLSPHAEATVFEALGILRAWGTFELGIADMRTVLAKAGAGETPAEVERAMWHLMTVDLSPLAAGHADLFDLDNAVERLLDGLDKRLLEVFCQRTLALDGRPTLEVLARPFGLTRERIRQLEAKTKRLVRSRLELPRLAVVKRSAARLRASLGVAYPETALGIDPRILALLGGSDLTAVRSLLMLWIAGPYERREGWLLLPQAERAWVATTAALDADSLDVDDAIAILEANGVASAVAAEFLQRLPYVRVVDGRAMLWRSGVADRAFALLREAGTPLGLEQISVAIADRNPRYVTNALLADPRFMRTGIRHFGLRGWDFNEYTTILDEIEEELEARGGEAPIKDLVETLVVRFGVSAGSVNTYASLPQFVRANGMIRVRDGSPLDPDGWARAIEYTPGCFRMDGGWAWRVIVDDALLRGSGRPVTPGFAIEIGLTKGATMTLPWPYGDFIVSWPRIQPSMSSIRLALNAVGAEAGDTVFVRFREDSGDIQIHHHRKIDLSEAPPDVALWLASGGIGRSGGRGLADLARSLGFSDDPPASLRAVQRRLRARREGTLMQLLDESMSLTG